jgi:hypothetical protein
LFWSNIRTNARLRAVEFRPNSPNSNWTLGNIDSSGKSLILH